MASVAGWSHMDPKFMQPTPMEEIFRPDEPRVRIFMIRCS